MYVYLGVRPNFFQAKISVTSPIVNYVTAGELLYSIEPLKIKSSFVLLLGNLNDRRQCL